MSPSQDKKRWSLPPLGTAAWLGAGLLLVFVVIGLVVPLLLSGSPSAQILNHLLEGSRVDGTGSGPTKTAATCSCRCVSGRGCYLGCARRW